MSRVLKEIWKFRALIWALTSRHLKARYRGSFFGFLWSFLNPLFLIAVYSLVFKYYMRFPEQDNYTVFMFTGLLPWIWFSSGLSEGTSSISGGGSLITKAIFPPHVLPLVSIITNFAHFIFALPLLFIAMFISNLSIHATIIIAPIIMLIQFIFMFGLVMTLASLNVYYRDIQHILGNVITLWFFLCPIIYPVSSVPNELKYTIILNPMASIIQSYQQVILDGTLPNFNALGIIAAISLLCSYFGCLIFNKYRDQFAEAI